MKLKFLHLIFFAGTSLLFACGGECVKCTKSGQQPLRYCEGDFPNSFEYKSQIEALDSLGYDCVTK